MYLRVLDDYMCTFLLVISLRVILLGHWDLQFNSSNLYPEDLKVIFPHVVYESYNYYTLLTVLVSLFFILVIRWAQ